MQRQSREENETGMCGRVQRQGESGKTYLRHLQATRFTALTSTSGHGSEKFFFHRASLKCWGKKRALVSWSRNRWVSSERTVAALLHTCAWAHLGVGPFSHSSFLCQKKNRKEKKKKASHLSAPFPFPSLTRAFPSKGEEEDGALPGSGLGTLAQAACQWSLCHTGTPSIKMASLGLTNTTVTLNASYCFY